MAEDDNQTGARTVARPSQDESRSLSEEVLDIGSLVADRFLVERFIAEGGMGRVYMATQQPLGRKVALKVMRRSLLDDPQAPKRFLREAVAVSKLEHPNSIKVYDFGETRNGDVYIAMEYLRGESLQQLIDREGHLTPVRALDIVEQVARSLCEAHEKGVVHRDLKPDNVFLAKIGDRDDFVKVLDFGIAKLLETESGSRITRAGYVCGTPEYMAPEQARGESVDGRSDLYAVGVILYELLSGALPFEGATPLSIVLKHQNDVHAPLDPSIPDGVRDLVDRLLAKERTERPPDARALVEEVLSLRIELGDARRTTPAGDRVSLSGATTPAPSTPSPGNSIALGGKVSGTEPTAVARKGGRSTTGARLAIAAIVVLLVAVAALVAVGPGEESGTVETAESTGEGGRSLEPESSATVAPRPGETERPTPVEVRVDSEPPGAAISVDGDTRGATPLGLELEPGAIHRLAATLAGYRSVERELRVPSDGSPPESVRFILEPERVPVRVTSDPAGARVVHSVTGELVCTTPCAEPFPLDASPLTLRIELAGHDAVERTLELRPGEEQHVEVELDEVRRARPPVRSRRPTPDDRVAGGEEGSPEPERADSEPGDETVPDEPDDPFRIIERR